MASRASAPVTEISTERRAPPARAARSGAAAVEAAKQADTTRPEARPGEPGPALRRARPMPPTGRIAPARAAPPATRKPRGTDLLAGGQVDAGDDDRPQLAVPAGERDPYPSAIAAAVAAAIKASRRNPTALPLLLMPPPDSSTASGSSSTARDPCSEWRRAKRPPCATATRRTTGRPWPCRRRPAARDHLRRAVALRLRMRGAAGVPTRTRRRADRIPASTTIEGPAVLDRIDDQVVEGLGERARLPLTTAHPACHRNSSEPPRRTALAFQRPTAAWTSGWRLTASCGEEANPPLISPSSRSSAAAARRIEVSTPGPGGPAAPDAASATAWSGRRSS